MPFQVKGKEQLGTRVTLRLSEAERAKLAEDADIAGLTISELIRRRYFGRPIVAEADMVMVRELRRQGGLLKHLMGSSTATDAEIMRTLAAMRRCVEKLTQGTPA